MGFRREHALGLLAAVALVCCAAESVVVSVKGPPAAPPVVVDASGGDALDYDAMGLADADDGATIDDPMALHHDAPEALRALMGPAGAIDMPVGGGAWRLSQGNRAVSRHAIGPRACRQ